MKATTFFGLLAMVLALSACETESIRASDEISSREYSFTDYSRLELAGDFDAYVRFSDTEERIEIEANENLQDKIIVSKTGSTLKIRLENNVNVRGNATMKAYITTRNIDAYHVSGDSFVQLENLLASNNISIEVSGDSRFTGELEANNLFVDLKGDSEIDAFGTANTLNADLSGDSELKDYDLTVEDLILNLSGDSEAFLYVSQTIDVDASGDSILNYRGDAEVVHQRLTGDSKIRKRD